MESEQERFTDALVESGFWIRTGVQGLFGRTHAFESIVSGFDNLIVEIAREHQAEPISFPPVVDREIIRRTDYMDSFPELCGSIHSFRESTASHSELIESVEGGGDWSPSLEQMPITLCPAACYPVYPMCSGTLPENGRLFDLFSYVFRAEPSPDPARLQCFRQRENVRVAPASFVRSWRDEWSTRALDLLIGLGLPAEIEVATDPFFGRGGRLLSANQLADEGKLEIVVPITSGEKPTAVASFNDHGDKFSRIFDIRTAKGEFAETACVGFGLERIALALLKTHGLDLVAWPGSVRKSLRL